MNNRILSTNQVRTESPGRIGGGRQWLMALVAGIAVFAAGCGTKESEKIGSIQAAMSESSCALATADQRVVGKVDPRVVSPSSYDNCDKAYVVEIADLAPDYAGEGIVTDGRISVSWGDTPITSQAVCEASQVAAILYDWEVGGVSNIPGGGTVFGPAEGWVVLQVTSQYGQWLGSSCRLEINFTDLVVGKGYRVAATARTRWRSRA